MRRLALVGAVLVLGLGAAPTALAAGELTFQEFVVSDSAMAQLRHEWLAQLASRHPAGTWAPLRVELTDKMLALMGLPPRRVLLSQRYPEPTMVYADGRTERVRLPSQSADTSGPTAATYAGAGWFGIRPGAWLLLLDDGIGWCSMAHVYDAPGSYQISTAGHCGKVGDTGTVIAAFGNRNGTLNPILLDFGKFSRSTGDAGVGKDWALIAVDEPWQGLVTPTMAFWGGPRGMYTKVGDVVSVRFRGRNFIPQVSVTGDPFLAQTLVHYGHGVGAGTGGTPRAGAAISWRPDHYMWFGVMTPGDSGSGANTLTGGTAGATMEAAGINTHLYIDPLMREGIGIMAGTRAGEVNAELANGQIVPYPVPAPGLP